MYLAASRRDKPEIAKLLVTHWRGLSPPGRFLAKRTTKSKSGEGETTRKLWYEIGDEAAKKRASKSLGEKQKVALTAKEIYLSSSSPSDKSNPKTRLRSLEARAARSEGRGRPRSEPPPLHFPVAQTPPDANAQSFLYQPIPLNLPGMGVDMNVSNTHNPLPSLLSPASFPSSAGLASTWQNQPHYPTMTTTQKNFFEQTFSRQKTATANLPTTTDVPTAAELTACWD